jgi:hypothetical protein
MVYMVVVERMEIKSHSHSLTSRRGKKKNYVVDQLLVCLGGSVHIQFAPRSKEQRHGGEESGSSLVGHLFLVCWS